MILFCLQLGVMLCMALGCGRIMQRFRQPRVLGELIGGILLGPTLFGALAPDVTYLTGASPHALAIAYILREAWDWKNLREVVHAEVASGRTLAEFKILGATSSDVFSRLSEASKKFGNGQWMAAFGSFGTDLVGFTNRHILITAVREGRLTESRA